MKKYILLASLLLSTVEAATVSTQSANIDATERVIVSVTDMPGARYDWVAIYPEGENSTFVDIVSYKYTYGKVAGEFDLGTVPAGNYEARTFNAKTWRPTASYPFTVTGVAATPTVTTAKDVYKTGETVTVSFSNMQGENRDWVAIFPEGARNTFANIVSYKFTNGIEAGDLNLGTIPACNYEARVFNANSWRPKASYVFTVQGPDVRPTISSTVKYQRAIDKISVDITDMPGNKYDWVDIFPAGAKSTFANIVKYRYTNGMANGRLDLGTVPAGKYEIRAFYANSWKVRASDTFFVTPDSPYIRTDKQIYIEPNEVILTLHNMPESEDNWVGVFHSGARSTPENLVVKKYTHDIVTGKLSLGTFKAGYYDIRVFYANSWRPSIRGGFLTRLP